MTDNSSRTIKIAVRRIWTKYSELLSLAVTHHHRSDNDNYINDNNNNKNNNNNINNSEVVDWYCPSNITVAYLQQRESDLIVLSTLDFDIRTALENLSDVHFHYLMLLLQSTDSDVYFFVHARNAGEKIDSAADDIAFLKRRVLDALAADHAKWNAQLVFAVVLILQIIIYKLKAALTSLSSTTATTSTATVQSVDSIFAVVSESYMTKRAQEGTEASAHSQDHVEAYLAGLERHLRDGAIAIDDEDDDEDYVDDDNDVKEHDSGSVSDKEEGTATATQSTVASSSAAAATDATAASSTSAAAKQRATASSSKSTKQKPPLTHEQQVDKIFKELVRIGDHSAQTYERRQCS